MLRTEQFEFGSIAHVGKGLQAYTLQLERQGLPRQAKRALPLHA
jgi:hypothetical protein